HVAGVLLLALLEEQSRAQKNLRAFGGRNEPPRSEGLLSGGHGHVHVFRVGRGEGAHDVIVVGGIEVEDGVAAARGQPFPADQIVIHWAVHKAVLSSRFSALGWQFRGMGGSDGFSVPGPNPGRRFTSLSIVLPTEESLSQEIGEVPIASPVWDLLRPTGNRPAAAVASVFNCPITCGYAPAYTRGQLALQCCFE